jgi:CRP-like cAMP-binding protein
MERPEPETSGTAADARPPACLRTILDEVRERSGAPLRQVRVERGEMLIHEGDPADCAWFLVSGRVRVFRISQDGASVVLAYRQKGDLLGELSMIDGGARSGSALAVSNVEAIAIPRPEFMRLLEAVPGFGAEVARQLATRVRETSERMFALAALPAPARLAAELFFLAGAGEDRRALRLVDAPTVTELAARINATRETVSKALNAWIHEGLIVRNGRDLVIHDPVGLNALFDTEQEGSKGVRE